MSAVADGDQQRPTQTRTLCRSAHSTVGIDQRDQDERAAHRGRAGLRQVALGTVLRE